MNTAKNTDATSALAADQVDRLRALVDRYQELERRSIEAEDQAERLTRRADRINERLILAHKAVREHLAYTMGLAELISDTNDHAPAVLLPDRVVILKRNTGVHGPFWFSVEPLLSPPAGAPAV